MSVLISVPSASGDILIEVDNPRSDGRVTRGGSADTLHKAAASFEEGWSRIKPVASQIIKQLSDSIEGTEEVKVRQTQRRCRRLHCLRRHRSQFPR